MLGGQLRSAVLTDGTRKGADFGEPTGLTSLDVPPEGRTAQVAYSGPWAQARGRAGKRPTQAQLLAVLDTGGRRDRDTLCASGGTAAGSDVVPLIERCWGAVMTVAQKLFRDGCVTHKDVCAALGLSPDPETRGIELAMIRSGSTPGSFSVTRPVN